MLLTVGERVWQDFDPRLARMGTGWAGGIALTEDLCGAVAAAVMLIGARHGRVTLEDSDQECLRLVQEFRARFERELGSLLCRDLKPGPFGPESHRRCAAIVRRATDILLDLLNDDGGDAVT
ncbi:MAG: C-GCAxxG-C-C family protein [Armatimonadota bacterium]